MYHTQLNQLETSLRLKKLESGYSLVTGGAGFIGSHLVDKLLSNNIQVRVLDNLSNGSLSNLSNWQNSQKFQFFKNDLNDLESIQEIIKDTNTIFHIAANPEVRTGFEHPEISYKENIQNTFHLLEAIRKSNVKRIVFASTSTVYGEPEQIPTSENYGPLLPISPYGASKLACEAMISSYCNNYGIEGLIFRFANIIGPRSNHGVIIDFIKKLRKNRTKLEILGDGKQTKSYLHVKECIDSFLFCISKNNHKTEIFNVGNNDKIDVINIAKIVSKCMNLSNVRFVTTGGVDGGRGWIGDVKQMQLDITKLKKLGWNPNLSSRLSVELATKELLKDL